MACELIDSLEPRRLCAGGFVGTYFDNTTFDGTTVSRNDATIAFNWKAKSPDVKIGTDSFSARWTGAIHPTVTGRHALYVSTEGGVRVWVNHKLVLNRWAAPGVVTHYKSLLRLTAGEDVDIQVEYQHIRGNASIGMTWIQPGAPAREILGNSATTAQAQDLADQTDHALLFAVDRIGATYRTLDPKNGVPTRSEPVRPNWLITPFTDWTAGSFAGAMWELDQAYPGAGWDALATQWTTPLANVHITGDAFAREYAAYRPLVDKTNDGAHKQVLIDSAYRKLGAWSKVVRAFRTPELVSTSGNPKANFGVLMDQSMDMEHLLWAGEATRNQQFTDRVAAHMYTVARTMVRKNGSVVQRGYFDAATGTFVVGENSQGYSNTSTWSRAVGWAIHSFATVGTALNNPDFLAVARKIADFYIANTPADGVPFWDYNAPNIPKTYKDTSAAAIAAGGMLKLDGAYRAYAKTILISLLSNTYLAEGAVVKGVLQHGAAHVPANKGVDASLMFGDYYLLRAVNDYRTLELTQ